MKLSQLSPLGLCSQGFRVQRAARELTPMAVQEASAGRAALQVFLVRPSSCTCLAAPVLRREGAVGSHVPVASVGRFCDGSSAAPWLTLLHPGEAALPLEEAGGNRLWSWPSLRPCRQLSGAKQPVASHQWQVCLGLDESPSA